MGLMRNKEIRQMLYVMLFTSFTATAAAYALPKAAALAAGLGCLSLGAVFIFFTQRRYRTIALLEEYLRRVNSGEFTLEIFDSDEGELSILKSEIYKVTVSLKEQNERLHADKLRLADALSDISHQFKTPLTSMSVMTELLSQETLDIKERNEFTRLLTVQLERLKWLTDTLLKLSKLDAQTVLFKPRSVSLYDLINRAASPLLIPIELKNQSLTLKADGFVFCDPNWTAEALSNILKNCIEHTPSGGQILITASENALFSEIRVSDSGPGIDKEDLPYLFDRFYKGKNTQKDSVGIGLAMAKTVTAAQGGTLDAGSASKNGALFIMRFPKK